MNFISILWSDTFFKSTGNDWKNNLGIFDYKTETKLTGEKFCTECKTGNSNPYKTLKLVPVLFILITKRELDLINFLVFKDKTIRNTLKSFLLVDSHLLGDNTSQCRMYVLWISFQKEPITTTFIIYSFRTDSDIFFLLGNSKFYSLKNEIKFSYFNHLNIFNTINFCLM